MTSDMRSMGRIFIISLKDKDNERQQQKVL